MSVNHLKNKTYTTESGFYLTRNCAMAASLKYLLVTRREIARKEKNVNFSRKSTKLLCMAIRLKNTKKNLKRVVRKHEL